MRITLLSWSAVTGCLLVLSLVETTRTTAAEPGQLAFNNRCRTCHSIREGDNRLGPSLHDIIGSKAGSSVGYANYSQSLVSSGVVWDEDTLSRFIENPDAVIPGNNMKPYGGLTNASERQEIVDYLKAQSEN